MAPVEWPKMSLFSTFCCLLVFIVSSQYLIYSAKSMFRSAAGPVFSPAFLRRQEAIAPAAVASAAGTPPRPVDISLHTASSWEGMVPLQGARPPAAAPALPPPVAPHREASAAAGVPNVQFPPRASAGTAAGSKEEEGVAAAAPQGGGLPAGPAPAPHRHLSRDFFCENRARSKAEAASVDSSSMTKFIASGGRFPIVVMTCNRAEQLERTLRDLLAVRCVLAADITVVADSCDAAEAIPGIALNAGVGYHLHDRPQAYPGEDGAARIASHYGYALGYALNPAGAPPGLIVVEDDMAFAPDFYEYFHAVAALLEADPTLWVASAWNDNGFDYLVADPLALRRTRYFPGLGWLLPRALWVEQLGVAWPPSHWDHWMRDPGQHRGRDVLYPEIPRDYHMGVRGTFMDTGTHNRYFGSIALADDRDFTWDTPEGAASLASCGIDAYESSLVETLGGKGIVHLDSLEAIAQFSEGVGVVWYSCSCLEPSHDSMRPLAAYFGVWHEGGRGSRDGLHELWWLGTARLFLINAGPPNYGPALNGAVEAAPPWLLQLKPATVKPLLSTDFMGASRPTLPQHKAVFGALWRTPLAHVDDGHDGNGPRDSGVGGGEVVVHSAWVPASRLGGGAGAAGQEDEATHVHSQFMGDYKGPRAVSAEKRVAKPAADAGAALGGAVARIGLMTPGSVVVSSKYAGIPCTAVCAGHSDEAAAQGGFRCERNLLPVVNTCEMLREHFKCASCTDSIGGDQPALVNQIAPRDKLPGSCLVNKDHALFSCEASYEYTQRLCPCVPL